MDRWSGGKVYLFWASVAGTTSAMVFVGIFEIQQGEWPNAVLIAPALIFIGICALLYRGRARTVESVRENEARLHLLIQEASDAIFVSDIESRRFVDVNRMATALTGYTREELISMRVEDLVDFAPYEEAEAIGAIRSGEVLRREETVIGKDGSRIPIEVSAVAVTDRLTQAIVRPIGERKAVEDALQRSEEVFRAVSELTSDYAYSMTVHPDRSLTPEWLTGAFERVTGYAPEELARGWQTLVHPDDVPVLSDILAKALDAGGTAEFDFRIITKAGEIRHLRGVSRYEQEELGGPVVRVIGAVSDVTEQKLLQDSLAESEQRFRHLYERLPVALYRRRYKGPTLGANPTCVEMFGFPDEESYAAVGPHEFYVDPRDREPWISELERNGVVRNYEVRYKRRDGSSFWGRNTARLVSESDGTSTIEGAIVDITEEKELHEELKATLRDLRRADLERKRLLTHLVRAKEEERSRVASDIHDDSVQLMTAVAIDLERLSRNAPEPTLRESLGRLENQVRDAVGRLRKMVFNLRPPALDEEGLASALRLYLEEFSLDTGIDYELRNDLDIEPTQPTRVALFRVAQEALTNIRKHSNASKVLVGLDHRGDGVMMVISDDGRGFDVTSDELNSPGHIGLAEMRERAEMAGGTCEIQSAPGKGTEVRVQIPEFSG